MTGDANLPVSGVAHALAQERSRRITDLAYQIALDIPADPLEPVAGRVRIGFTLTDAQAPLVLDFAAGDGCLHSVEANGKPSRHIEAHGHIVIPADELRPGENHIEVAFRPADGPLNRRPDLLYTLFVPARAHEALPCFDQPDLKARFSIELTIPAAWEALSNGAETERESVDEERVRIRFAETAPISTYLLAIAAGRFQIESATRHDRVYRMFHREADLEPIARNGDAIFDLHASAMRWLEEYTGIDYPFGKFDFVLIPSFQFAGMEHPGAVYYDARALLLDASASEHQRLARAHLIAHETAHMWFGDLVTMRWFDDVWMKEVFANLMAAKIVNPAFPDLDHELRFLLSHYPAAYSVDRTAGTHAIRQDLDNLLDAGSLYGPIIYQKAPIVMRQLEQLMKPSVFRDALRAYLIDFGFGSAAWPDLLRLFRERTDHDLVEWSRTWIEEAGHKPPPPNIVADVTSGTCRLVPRTAPLPDGVPALNADARALLLDRIASLNDPVARGVGWITLWEEMLEGRVEPIDFLAAIAKALPIEVVEQNVQLMCGYLVECYWRYFPPARRPKVAPRLEAALLARTTGSPMASAVFAAFRSMATTDDGVGMLKLIWQRKTAIPALVLSEADEMAIALELLIRSVPDAAAIVEAQRERISDDERRARFDFVLPAASVNPRDGAAFFARLADPQHRRREPWVIEGLRYLNHPLRASHAIKFLRRSLELLEEVERTGDIFFPKRWMEAVLSGHHTPEAAAIVRRFLADHPHYPDRLRRVILQAADPLFRVTRTSHGTN